MKPLYFPISFERAPILYFGFLHQVYCMAKTFFLKKNFLHDYMFLEFLHDYMFVRRFNPTKSNIISYRTSKVPNQTFYSKVFQNCV